MIGTTQLSRRIGTLLAILIVLLSAAGVPRIIAVINDPLNLFAFLSLLGLYVSAVLSSARVRLSFWNGLMRLPVMVAWLSLGVESAAMIVIVGSAMADALGVILSGREREMPRSIILEMIASNGFGVLASHATLLLLNGSVPVMAGAYLTVPLLIALLVGSAVSLMTLVLLSPNGTAVFSLFLRRNWLSETLIVLVALVLPMFLFEVGGLPFLVIVLLLASQTERAVSISRTQDQLDQRVREISTLSSIGEAAAAQISLTSVLEMISQRLAKLIDATSLYIALYDDHLQTLDYPLVLHNGEAVSTAQHELDDSLIAQVVKNRNAFWIASTDANPPRALGDLAQFMAAPLIVGQKIIGVLAVTHESNPLAFGSNDFDLLKTVANQASLAIRNATLYDRTVRLADNLAIINQSLQDVMFSLDRDDALATACQLAIAVTQAQRAAIFLAPPNSANLQFAHAHGYESLDVLQQLVIPAARLKDGARIVNDMTQMTDPDMKQLAEAGAFSACAQIPLSSGSNTVTGALIVTHDSAHFYDQPERNLLEMLANQIVAALDNSDLLNTLEKYAAEQAQLVHLSRISSENLNLERVITDVCVQMTEIMQVRRVEIGLLQPERGLLRLRYPDPDSFDLVARDVQVAAVPELDKLLNPSSIITLRTFMLDEGADLSEGLRTALAQSGDQTLVVTPMRVDGQATGLVLMAHDSKRYLSDADYRLVEMATNQITTQIHNARLHTRTEEDLVQRLEQLALIEEIAQQISRALDSHTIIENVLEAALQATQADFASLAIENFDGGETYNIISREVVGDHLLPGELTNQPLHGIIEQVMESAQTVIVEDNDADPIYTAPPAASQTFRSTLAVPLIVVDDVIGVLKIESIQHDFFTLEHGSFIKSLAGHAAISINNARLLTEREQQISTLTLLRELSLEALSVVTADDINDTILRTALIILHAQETILYEYERAEMQMAQVGGVRFGAGSIENSGLDVSIALIQEVAQGGEIVVIEDTRQHPAFAHLDSEQLLYRSLLLIPVKRRDLTSNVLCAAFNDVRRFDNNIMNTAELLRAQIAGHMENVLLNEAIRTSNNRMRAILDSTRDGIILLDSHGRVQDANSAAITLSGWPLLTGLGEPLIIIGEQQETPSQFMQIAEAYDIEPSRLHEREFDLMREGDLLSLRTFIYRVEDQYRDTAGWLLVLRDITQEKELKIFRDKIQSMVLHDLRGPLSSIMTSMYMALSIVEDPGDMPFEESLVPTLQVSLDSANDLLHMTDTLRDLPMITKMQIDAKAIPLVQLADKAYRSLSSNILESNIEVEIDIPDDQIAYIDDSLIRRVFVNLMHNAFKFTPEDGTILLRSQVQDDDRLLVQVADTGPGIPDEERERIFGEFVQIKGRRPRAGGKGMGLGLNFCKLAVEAHGGNIWVERDGPLSGACFSFTLPRYRTDQEPQATFQQNIAD